jgi:hypothetical protein
LAAMLLRCTWDRAVNSSHADCLELFVAKRLLTGCVGVAVERVDP